MGIYATTTSLEVFMIGTTFDTATTSLADKTITHAENEINKYISKRYDISSFYTTTATVPPIITSLCEQLSIGYMHQHMSRGGKESMARGKFFIDMAMKNLESIAKYELNITDSSGAVIADISGSSYNVKSTTENYANTFNEDSPLNWEVSSTKLDDISSERN